MFLTEDFKRDLQRVGVVADSVIILSQRVERIAMAEVGDYGVRMFLTGDFESCRAFS